MTRRKATPPLDHRTREIAALAIKYVRLQAEATSALNKPDAPRFGQKHRAALAMHGSGCTNPECNPRRILAEYDARLLRATHNTDTPGNAAEVSDED